MRTKLTKQQALENHRKMWNWIADETLRQKKIIEKIDYFKAMEIPISMHPLNNCYCCEYAKNGDCNLCPIIWINEHDMEIEDYCSVPSTHFIKWTQTCNYKEAAKYARMIANLPERK